MKVGLWAEIHRLHEIERLTRRSIARRLHCSRRTVKRALAREDPPGKNASRPAISIIDPHKPAIDKLLDKYPDLSAVRVLEEIRKSQPPYPGEITLVRNYLREVRPARGRVYQEVQYAPGEAMQVDWGNCGLVRVGEIMRKVSVFVAVLCFSRLLYIEFTLSQTKGTFYRSIIRALRFFGGCVAKIIVDNLKAAVLAGSGQTARFHPEFEALCAYHGRMRPIACERSDPESKGVVEGGVRFIKHNALKGRAEELVIFEDFRKLAIYWPDNVANVRKHETTGERPVDRFEQERGFLRPLPEMPYDADDVIASVVSPHARVKFDTNRYSVPPEYTRKHVILRANDEEVRVVHRGAEIARHPRSYERRRILVIAHHQEAAFALRRRVRARQVEAQFDALGPDGKAFRLGLIRSPLKPIVHLRRILGFVRLYGRAEVLAAISKALEFQTFDAAYVMNLIDQERRKRLVPSPIPLAPKRRDLVEEIQLDEPDPGHYDRFLDEGDQP